MEYSKIKDFDKYKSVFDHKVAQLRRPQERQALVIFFRRQKRNQTSQSRYVIKRIVYTLDGSKY